MELTQLERASEYDVKKWMEEELKLTPYQKEKLGEAGEVANCVKKIRITELRPEWTIEANKQFSMPAKDKFEDDLNVELSDQLFYLVRLAKDNGSSLEDLINIQTHKIKVQSLQYGRTFLK